MGLSRGYAGMGFKGSPKHELSLCQSWGQQGLCLSRGYAGMGSKGSHKHELYSCQSRGYTGMSSTCGPRDCRGLPCMHESWPAISNARVHVRFGGHPGLQLVQYELTCFWSWLKQHASSVIFGLVMAAGKCTH
eukprot:scaffold99580_cov23-Tisochrysis_lutea.AAC.2